MALLKSRKWAWTRAIVSPSTLRKRANDMTGKLPANSTPKSPCPRSSIGRRQAAAYPRTVGSTAATRAALISGFSMVR